MNGITCEKYGGTMELVTKKRKGRTVRRGDVVETSRPAFLEFECPKCGAVIFKNNELRLAK
jgi:predicted RNA-binding Zn-ribbon protein involved in translation (DUF1610 family)